MIPVQSDPHEILDEAFALLRWNEGRVIVVRDALARVGLASRGLRVVQAGVSALLQVWKVWRASRNADVVLVREFWNWPTLLLSPLLAPLRKRVVLNVNHNLKGLPGICPYPIRILSAAGFQFLLFDGRHVVDSMPAAIARQFVCPPFPLPMRKAFVQRLGSASLTVGFVGDFRAEKGGEVELVRVVRQLVSLTEARVLIGARGNKVVQDLKLPVDAFYDTTTRDQFLDYLGKLDALIVLVNSEAYFARHSGTVMDAISQGVIPVVPDLPVFRAQVRDPCQVGVTYRNLNEIVAVVTGLSTSVSELRQNGLDYARARALVRVSISSQDAGPH